MDGREGAFREGGREGGREARRGEMLRGHQAHPGEASALGCKPTRGVIFTTGETSPGPFVDG
jgi:hypothetical protein